MTLYGVNDDLEKIGRYFGLDANRFKVVGLSIYETENFYVSLICIDKSKSTDTKEHLVKMSMDINDSKNVLDTIFKRFHVGLHDKHDNKYRHMDYNEEVSFSDFHQTEEEI